ncbi:MAG: peptidoglycan-binding protein LysM [Arenicella sp.]|nr:peptidoglycan-binding protein LysM [Arenicella sp.]
MGLFDFAANIGKKVFGVGDADAAEKIKQDIESNNPGIENLEVEMQEDTVCVLRGICESVEAKEKAILMAGNMKGVSAVVAARLKVAESADAGATVKAGEEQEDSAFEASIDSQFYTIESGDTLWAIAAKFLGNGSKYPEIFEANREVIEDPDKIFPGQKIRIPSSSSK